MAYRRLGGSAYRRVAAESREPHPNKSTLASSPNAMAGRSRAGIAKRRMGEWAMDALGDQPKFKASATILSTHGDAESIAAHLRNRVDTLFRTFCAERVLRRSQRTGER